MSRNYQQSEAFRRDELAMSRRLDEYAQWRKTQPCKDKQKFVRSDGGCLRCDADHGEECREIAAIKRGEQS